MAFAPERFSSVADLAGALAAGTVSSEAILDTAVSRHQQCGKTINAYCVWAEPEARVQAKAADAARAAGAHLGPLQGIPVSIKDCIGFAGLPTFAGSAARLSAKWERDGFVVDMLRRQLAVVTGKTVQTEFALSSTGVTPYVPQPINPWDLPGPGSAGGSSTGAGLSLLEGSAVLALGTDTVGSVRIPASATGTVGFKPGIGYWSTDGVVPLSPTLDSIGMLARTVDDLVFGVAALGAGYRRKEVAALQVNDLHIGMVDACFSECSPSIVAAVMAAAKELENSGAQIRRVELPEAAEAFRFVQDGAVVVAEFAAFLASELPAWRTSLLPATAALAERGTRVSASRYLADRDHHLLLAARASQRFAGDMVLAVPTLPISPPRMNALSSADDRRQIHLSMLRHTCIASYLRLCAITLPVGIDSEGMPVGLELMAPRGREEYLLSVALTVERTLGTPLERLGCPPH